MTATATAVRPFEMFDVRVARTRRVTPRLVRITFAGEPLAHFADVGYDQRIKLILPPEVGSLDDVPRGEDWFARWREMPQERRAPVRTYTVREVRPQDRELDVDLVDHGDLGPASAFARRAEPGDRILVLGPNAAHPGPHGGREFPVELAGATDLLLVGDDTAAPAICSIIERLPAHARGIVVIEVEHADSIQSMPAPPGIRLEWRVRQGERGAATHEVVREWLTGHPLVGSAADGRSTVYIDGTDGAYWETTTERGAGIPPLAAWIAGESAVVRSLRRVLVNEYAVPRSAVAFMGYWREGRSEI